MIKFRVFFLALKCRSHWTSEN